MVREGLSHGLGSFASLTWEQNEANQGIWALDRILAVLQCTWKALCPLEEDWRLRG